MIFNNKRNQIIFSFILFECRRRLPNAVGYFRHNSCRSSLLYIFSGNQIKNSSDWQKINKITRKSCRRPGHVGSTDLLEQQLWHEAKKREWIVDGRHYLIQLIQLTAHSFVTIDTTTTKIRLSSYSPLHITILYTCRGCAGLLIIMWRMGSMCYVISEGLGC